MSIQAALNEDAMNFVPKIKKFIAEAERFEANQLEQMTLRAMMNSSKPIVDMNDKEIEQFQTDLLVVFRHYKWINEMNEAEISLLRPSVIEVLKNR